MKARLSWPVDEARGKFDPRSGYMVRRVGGLNVVSRSRVVVPGASANQAYVRTQYRTVTAGWAALSRTSKLSWGSWAAARAAEGTLWGSTYSGIDAYRQVNLARLSARQSLQNFIPFTQSTRLATSGLHYYKDFAGFEYVFYASVSGAGTENSFYGLRVQGPLWGEGASVDAKGYCNFVPIATGASITIGVSAATRSWVTDTPAKSPLVGEWMAYRLATWSSSFWLASVVEGIIEVEAGS